MNNTDELAIGFYGKIPALGDFVSRRLNRNFIDFWDQWLQSSMRASQEILGENWLSTYLVSPIWRFALSPGICGNTAWAGILMPSVDKVGRYYPLTLVQAVDPQCVTALFLPESNWFEQLENLALSVLDEAFDFEYFDQALLKLELYKHLPPLQFVAQSPENTEMAAGKYAFRYDLDDLNQVSGVFPGLSLQLLTKLYPSYSFWAGTDSQLNQSRFLCCESMPPIETYASFLQGLPRHSAWKLQSHALNPQRRAMMPADLRLPVLATQIAQTQPGLSHWQSAGLTVVGNLRKHNEDAMLDKPQQGLWVVADGMGGHQAGDVASQAIVNSLAEMRDTDTLAEQINQVAQRLKQVNTHLCQYAASINHNCVVGSTVVTLLAKERQCALLWAGDSRLYQFRQGQLTQLSRDHSMVDEMMMTQNISREEASRLVGANVITRAVGGHNELEIECIEFQAEVGDRFLLCSDGLDKELSETEIAQLMTSGDCQMVVTNLIDQALAKNGRDNITAIVVEYG